MRKLLIAALVLGLALGCAPVWAGGQVTINGVPRFLGPPGSLTLNGDDQRAERIWMYDAASQNLGLLYGGGPGSNARATARTVWQSGQWVTVPAGQPAFSNRYDGRWRLDIAPATTNHFLASAAPANQSISLGTGTYCLWVEGAGSAEVAAGTATITGAGTATAGSYVTFVVTAAGTVTITISGELSHCQVQNGPVPGPQITTTVSSVSIAADANSFALSQALKNISSTAEGPATAVGTLVVRGWVPGYSAADISNQSGIISVRDGGVSILYHGTAASKAISAYDGVNNPSVVQNWIAGQSYDHVVRWSSDENIFQVCTKLSVATAYTCGSETAFNDAFILGTKIWIGYSPAYPFQVGSVTFYNKALTADQLAWMDSLSEWVAEADDYWPVRAVAWR